MSDPKDFREALVQIRERAFRIAKINCPDTCSEWTHPLCWIARTADAALRAAAEPVPALSRCPFCDRPADDKGGIWHEPNCEGLQDAGLNKLQHHMLKARASQPPAPALRPDGMPEPSLDVLKCVAARMRTDAPDSAYLVEWAAEQIEQLTAIARAARNVCAYDWSDNDDDAVATIDRLHAVVGPWLARSTPTKEV